MELRIRELRAAKGLTQAELADAAGIRVATLSEIETGQGNPRMSTLRGIASILKVHVVELFPLNPTVDDAINLRDKINKLEPETRALIESIIHRQ